MRIRTLQPRTLPPLVFFFDFGRARVSLGAALGHARVRDKVRLVLELDLGGEVGLEAIWD